MTQQKIDKRLKEIAADIAKGKNPNAFQKELDTLLGTTMEDRDLETEIAWENEYQGFGEGGTLE